MRTLDRYQLREFLVAFGYCLAGILIFWVSFELLGEIDELRRRELGMVETLVYLGHRLPLYLLLQIPVALLLALLYSVTQLARHQELVAMRSAGLSLWRISLPYLGVAFFLSLGLLALNEFLVPDAAARAEAVLERASVAAAAARSGQGAGIGADTPGGERREWRQNLAFRDPLTGRTWFVRQFDLVQADLVGADIQWNGEEGRREQLIAERGHWDGQGWTFEDVTRFTFFPGTNTVVQSHISRLEVRDFPETPAHLRSEVKISRMLGSLKRSGQIQLSLREILRYRELHLRLTPGFDALLRTWFHDRLATPWTCVVVVLIGIPAAAGAGRRNVFVGVATSIFLAFGYFVLKEFSLAAGSGGYVSPWLAAWLPNVVFGALGAVGIHRMP